MQEIYTKQTIMELIDSVCKNACPEQNGNCHACQLNMLKVGMRKMEKDGYTLIEAKKHIRQYWNVAINRANQKHDRTASAYTWDELFSIQEGV